MTKKKKTERDRKRERRVGRCVEWQLEREKLNGGFLDSERNITFYHETFHRGYLSTVPSFLLLFFYRPQFRLSFWLAPTDGC